MKGTDLLKACYAPYKPEFGKASLTAAQRAGISFEKAVQKKLTFLYPKVECGPWLYYKTKRTANVCQPDALLWLTDNHLCVVECKLTWVASARAKLKDFYCPIVQHIYPDAQISLLQVYKNAKPQSHKRAISMYELAEKLTPGKYKECQWIGL